MAIEVELKAHITNPRHIQVAIEALAGVGEAVRVDKEDLYLSVGDKDLLVRVRSEEDRLTITHKTRSIDEGIERNKEIEFNTSADQRSAVLAFFERLDYRPLFTKRKIGLRYSFDNNASLPPMNIEVCEVTPLGWFVEMEYVIENSEDEERARRALVQTLSLVGIDRSQIESRPYMILLKEQGSAVHPLHPNTEQSP